MVAIKPVESGCDLLTPEERDGSRLAAATGQSAPHEALQSFGPAVAPPVAARAVSVELSLESWLEAIRDHAHGADLVLVEGAGGLLSPLTDTADTRDLVRSLGAEVLLVAADRLGVLNQVLLTVEALDRSGAGVVAVVLSAPREPDASTGRNQEELERRLAVPIVPLPRCSEAEAAGHLRNVLPLLSARPRCASEAEPL